MAADSLPVVAILLFVAAAAGWFLARFTSRPHSPGRPLVPPAEFYRGLNHILRDESDKAIMLLQSMAQADSGTVEIHFALGTLFRQRGETDRAIKIHQNLLARPDLPRRYREQALLALADDYLKAGLYDRAESLFVQLIEQDVRPRHSLEKLASIYERQRDWSQAIETRRRLAQLAPGPHDEVVAHYYCELAQQARAGNDLVAMRALLKQAQQASRGVLRGALMRADLATLTDDLPLAMRLYRRILETAPEMAAIVLRRLHGCHEPDAPELSRLLSAALKRQPQLAEHLARASLATGLSQNPVLNEITEEFIGRHPTLSDLSKHYEGNHAQLTALLRSLGLAALEFRCIECGYKASELNWQCPACQSWGSAQPRIAMTA